MLYVQNLKAIRLITALLLATVVMAVVGTAVPATAQGFVYDFPTAAGDVVFPAGVLTQGRDGNMYGITASIWDVPVAGAIYKLTPAGTATGIYGFANDGSEGTYCTTWTGGVWGLTLGGDGNFYGACTGGGTPSNSCGGDYGCGTVYSITPDGAFKVLHSFLGDSEGADPLGPLTPGVDGNLYGTTSLGGSGGGGTVYKVTPSGTLTTVHSFTNDGNGYEPVGPLFLGSDGNFYGTTSAGGTSGEGEVFKMTAKGKITILHSFTGLANDGGAPVGGVVQGADGSFYGATFRGGSSNEGTLFKVTPGKKFTLLHSFDLVADYGILPAQPIVQATNGVFYGVATSYAGGGYANNGSAFKFTLGKKGGFSVLFDFDPAPGGVVPLPDSPLLTHTSGLMYGTTYQGGPNSSGQVYSVDPGVAPFVTLQTKSGKVGTSVNILGQGFNNATGVAFNGTPASYTAVSDTFMTAIIPSGVTKPGFVTVAEPAGTLKSSFKFKVKP